MTAIWRKPKPTLSVATALLTAGMPGIPVSTGQPTTRPQKYIVLGLVTSDYPNPAFTEPRLLVNCYATTSVLAGDLADDALTVLLNARGVFAGATVKKFGNPQGPYPLNDPEITDRYRRQFHGDLRISTR